MLVSVVKREENESYADFAVRFDASYGWQQRRELRKRLIQQSYSGILTAIGSSIPMLLLKIDDFDSDDKENHSFKFGLLKGSTRVFAENGAEIHVADALGICPRMAKSLGGGAERLADTLLIGFRAADCEKVGVRAGDRVWLKPS